MQTTNTILLCAGKINYINLPVSTNTSNSMVPINGKPVIGWILEDLLQKKIKDVIVVLRSEDIPLKEFLHRAFYSRIQLSIVELKESESILHSLFAGLAHSKSSGMTRVILGDTLIQDTFESKDDFLYVQEVEDSSRWCLAKTDTKGFIQSYIEKQPFIPNPHNALCGYYHFQDGYYLKTCVEKALKHNQRQLSDALSLYQKEYPIQVRWVKKWFDFGNIDNLIKAKQQLLQSRYFNSLCIDPVLNTITKVSEYDEKLRNELNWYESIPEKLKVLTPRIISKEEKLGRLHLVQEYYGYPTLAELFLYSNLNLENWTSILQKLLAVHQEFAQFKQALPKEDYHKVYVEKTFSRLEKLTLEDGYWQKLFTEKEIVLNGKPLINIGEFKSQLSERANELVNYDKASIIHGDYCFSNILYDINNQIVRLIDPRGSFGSIGIYGDPRYDIAKLRHSVCGLYDYIVSDLFEVSESENQFKVKIFANELTEQISPIFDQLISEIGYDPEEIKFIEALLFLSMLPLHKDKPLRQRVLFLTGLSRLNELFVCV